MFSDSTCFALPGQVCFPFNPKLLGKRGGKCGDVQKVKWVSGEKVLVPERGFKNAERSRDVKSERAAEIQIGKMVGGHCLPV